MFILKANSLLFMCCYVCSFIHVWITFEVIWLKCKQCWGKWESCAVQMRSILRNMLMHIFHTMNYDWCENCIKSSENDKLWVVFRAGLWTNCLPLFHWCTYMFFSSAHRHKSLEHSDFSTAPLHTAVSHVHFWGGIADHTDNIHL